MPLALVGVGLVALAGVFFYLNDQSSERDRLRQQAAAQAELEEARKRRLNSESMSKNEWQVRYIKDPASGESTPRYASVYSRDGLFLLQAESRLNGTKLISFYSQLNASAFGYYGYGDTLEIKFDGWDRSRRVRVGRFNESDDIYISDSVSSYSEVSFSNLVRELAGQNTLAIRPKLKSLGQQWVTFPLTGSRSALTKIGFVSARPADGVRALQHPSTTTPVPTRSTTMTSTGSNSPDVSKNVTTVRTSQIVVPENAYIAGNNWYCSSGYRRIGNSCSRLVAPTNAYVYGNNWHCNSGYRRVGNSCIAMVQN